MANTFTYDVTNDMGMVRLLIEDYDFTTTTGARDDWTCAFTDEEITAFLTSREDSIYGAASLALHSIANSKAKLAARRKMGDYDEDLTGMAIQLRQQAKEFEGMEKDVPADAVAEIANDEFSARTIRANRVMREL